MTPRGFDGDARGGGVERDVAEGEVRLVEMHGVVLVDSAGGSRDDDVVDGDDGAIEMGSRGRSRGVGSSAVPRGVRHVEEFEVDDDRGEGDVVRERVEEELETDEVLDGEAFAREANLERAGGVRAGRRGGGGAREGGVVGVVGVGIVDTLRARGAVAVQAPVEGGVRGDALGGAVGVHRRGRHAYRGRPTRGARRRPVVGETRATTHRVPTLREKIQVGELVEVHPHGERGRRARGGRGRGGRHRRAKPSKGWTKGGERQSPRRATARPSDCRADDDETPSVPRHRANFRLGLDPSRVGKN